jgi:hypothetical protein
MMVGFVAGCTGGPGMPSPEVAATTAPLSTEQHVARKHYGRPAISPFERIAQVARPTQDAPINTAPATAPQPTLAYNGGSLIQSVEVTAVFWGPSVNPNVVSGAPGFFGAVTNSPYMTMLAEYNQTGNTIGTGSFTGSYVDMDAPVPPSGTNLMNEEIQAELGRLIDLGKIPANDGKNIFMVFFPPGVVIDQGNGQLSCQYFCAYHSAFTRNGSNVFYGVMPDHYGGGCDQGCGTADPLSNLYRSTSHELTEAITDPVPGQGWYDNNFGEIGDICVDFNGTTNNYTVQTEWSNEASGCRDHKGTAANTVTVTFDDTLVTAIGGSMTYKITSTGTGTMTLEASEIDLSSKGFPGTFSPTTMSANGGSSTLTVTVPTGVRSQTVPFNVGAVDADGVHHFARVNLHVKGAAATITGITPATGPTQGGTSFEIDGTNFGLGATAFVCRTSTCSATGRIPIQGSYVGGTSGTKFTGVMPSHAAGAVTIGLMNANDTTITKVSYTYTAGAKPTVAAVDPPSGPTAGGTFTIITGTGFSSNATVTFGGTALLCTRARRRSRTARSSTTRRSRRSRPAAPAKSTSSSPTPTSRRARSLRASTMGRTRRPRSRGSASTPARRRAVST